MIDLRKERVLVTGGSGFLGRHVCALLADRCKEMWAPSHEGYDLLDPEKARIMFDVYGPTVVIHLAAYCGGIGKNQRHPSAMATANLLMGLEVLEQCCAFKAKAVMVGSVCSYPKHCHVPFKESDLWNGYPEETNAAYGIAKRTLFEVARANHQEFGLPVACLLPANLYGPGDNFDLETSHVIPAMIRKMVEAKEDGLPSVTLWGTGTPTREFLYAEDCAEAILRAAERIETPEPMNLGNGKEISIYELAHVVKSIVEYDGQIEWDHERPDGQPRRCLDTSRAKELLGWEAKTSLADGLRKTVEWYKANRMVTV